MLATLLLLLTVPPSDYVARFEQALIAFDAGRFDEAARLFEVAGELAPDAPVWRVHAAAALVRTGEAMQAEEHVRDALRLGYAPSDLRAIDRRLVPRVRIAPDLVADHAQPVTSFGSDGSLAPMTGRFEDDHYLHGGRAWDLALGALAATRRTEDWNVVGRATHGDGTVEEIRIQRARRWDHIDGRVLEWASVGDTTAWSPLLDPIKHLGRNAQDRGFRLGLWCDGLVRTGEPRAVSDGQRLRLEIGDRYIAFDLKTHSLTKESAAPERQPKWRQSRAIREDERDAIESALGEAPLIDDQIIVLDGVDRALLIRWWFDRSSESPLTVLDLGTKRVLARPRPYGDRRSIWPGIGHAMYAADAGVLVLCGAWGRELAAYSTASWERLWQADIPDRVGGVRAVGSLLFVDRLRRVYDLMTGERRFDIESAPVRVTDVLDDGRLLVGANWGEVVVMDGRDPSTILFLWFDRDADGEIGVHVMGVDGTFAVPARTIRNGHVLHAGRFVPARDLAPWLWDPLHVRSLTDDQDRAPRDVPVGR